MNRIKIDEESNEGDSFYVVDEVYLGGQDSEIKKLINEARKEAYVSGFNRGQSQAYSGFWNESCQKLFKEDEENRKRDEHEHCWTARWSSTTVRRMLQNEKYQGDLLLQKYYTVSFLTGECARNEGALEQYFVMDAHEGIVSREEWEAVQQERARRLAYREEFQLKKLENTNPFFNRIRCAACGGMVVRGYGKAERKPFWRCAAACRKHRGTRTRTTFPEQEVRRVMVGTEHPTDF